MGTEIWNTSVESMEYRRCRKHSQTNLEVYRYPPIIQVVFRLSMKKYIYFGVPPFQETSIWSIWPRVFPSLNHPAIGRALMTSWSFPSRRCGSPWPGSVMDRHVCEDRGQGIKQSERRSPAGWLSLHQLVVECLIWIHIYIYRNIYIYTYIHTYIYNLQ